MIQPRRPSKLRAQQLTAVVDPLLVWYAHHARELPWRGRKRTAYQILVAEVMLQQTTAATVAKRLPIFLRTFPTARRLAEAELSTVLRAWLGLGYNRRALSLHQAAKAIQHDHRGRMPRSYQELRQLPGVGDYTCAALQTFAFGEDVPLVDVNIQRVLSRLYGGLSYSEQVLPITFVKSLDSLILPSGKSDPWHQALMDLSAAVCKRRRPDCAICPMAAHCASAYKIKERAVKPPAEVRILGVPRRLLRGRVLKLVAAANEGVTRASIASALREQCLSTNRASEISVAIRPVIQALLEEGFIEETKGRLILKH